MQVKNYGLKIPEIKKGNKLGLSIPFICYQPDGQWDSYLSKNEYQCINNVETQACTAFGTLGAVETLINRVFGDKVEFSERFLAKNSGTDPKDGGNDPDTVAESLSTDGVVVQKRWDFTDEIKTVDEFYSDIPVEVLKFATKDFNYSVKRQYVGTDIFSIKKALQSSPVGFSVYAWQKNENEIYYKPDGVGDVHWVYIFGYDDEKQALKIRDSYADNDNNFKLYSYDSVPKIVIRYYVERGFPQRKNWALDLFNRIWSFIKDVLTK
jgi:hypothetical protein